MALVDEVTSRIANERLVQLTNPGLPSATSVDLVRLGLAATDAQAEFRRRTGITFDVTDDAHVDLGVGGVVCKLQERSGVVMSGDESVCAIWRKGLADIRSGRRVSPQTNATQIPTRDNPDETPRFDQTRFDDVTPDQNRTNVPEESR